MFAEFQQSGPIRPTPVSGLGRVVSTRRPVHIIDAMAQQHYIDGDPYIVTAVKLSGSRTLIFVPMLKDAELIGTIAIYRREVRPFTDKQIELLTHFAAQAVIAIENTRLLNELRQRTTDLGEALEQQTASSEVLRVISTSPGDLEPVFGAILENATRICQASFGTLYLTEGSVFRLAATHNVPPAYAEARQRDPIVSMTGNSALAQVAKTKSVVQITDVAADAAYLDDPQRQKFATLTGARTLIAVPMLKDDTLIGVIGVYRLEVRPFTDKQIALMQNFAAQAVIAIENTRLLNELRESLDHQTATADILRVIASTPEDSKRALDTIAETAARIFAAGNVNFRRIEGNVLRVIGAAGPSATRVRELLPDFPLEPTDPAVRSVFENRQIAIEDRRATLPNEDGEIARVLRDLPIRSQAFTP